MLDFVFKKTTKDRKRKGPIPIPLWPMQMLSNIVKAPRGLWSMVKVPKRTTKARESSWGLKEESPRSLSFKANGLIEKMGQKSADRRFPKRNRNKEANVIEGITQYVFNINLSTVVTKMNLVGKTQRNGGLVRVLPVMCALIKASSPFFNLSQMERKCTWGILLHLKSKVKGNWC